jgi:hypothetical protein
MDEFVLKNSLKHELYNATSESYEGLVMTFEEPVYFAVQVKL